MSEQQYPCNGRIVHEWTAELAPGKPKIRVTEYGIVWAVFEGKALWSARHIEPASARPFLTDVEIDALRVVDFKDIKLGLT